MKHRRRRACLLFLLSTFALGVGFLGIKAYEWHHEYTQQLMPVHGLTFVYPGEQPQIAELFFNFYYAMTGLHAAHMAIGLGLLALLAVSVATAAYLPAPVAYVIVGGCAAGMAGLILVVFMGLRRADGWQRVFALGGWLWLGFLVFLTAVGVLGR